MFDLYVFICDLYIELKSPVEGVSIMFTCFFIWRTIPAKIHGLNFQFITWILNINIWILHSNRKFYTLVLYFTSSNNVFTLFFCICASPLHIFKSSRQITKSDPAFFNSKLWIKLILKLITVHCWFLSFFIPEPVHYTFD